MRPGFVKIAQICDRVGRSGPYDTWLVRVLSPEWYDLGERASLDVRTPTRSVVRAADNHSNEGYPVIVMAIVTFIGDMISVTGAFAIVHDNTRSQTTPWISLLYPGFKRSYPKGAHHLAIMRWFLFDLCGLQPWQDIPSLVMNDMAVPRPLGDAATWQALHDHESRELFAAAVERKRPAWADDKHFGVRHDAELFDIAKFRVERIAEAGFFNVASAPTEAEPIRFHIVLPDSPGEMAQDHIAYVLGWQHKDGWYVRDEFYIQPAFGQGADILDTLRNANLAVPLEEWDDWFEANVTMEGDQEGDICRVELDIEVEPYRLLGQQVPYLWADDDFLGYVEALGGG